MLKKFKPNLSYSLVASKFGESDVTIRSSIVDDLIACGATAIAEKDHDIKAFTAKKEPLTTDRFAMLPLGGIPVGVKDIIDTADMPTQHGSPIYEANQPRADAAVVRMIKRAGGQVLHKTVTTEFAFLTPNVTSNPHNFDHTPGGSSSGSAAAVGAGMLPFSFGTQTGGSIIRPASYCGVVGFKPSFNSFPTVGTKTFSWTLDTLGFFAPSIPDAQFLWSKLMQTPTVQRAHLNRFRIGIAKTKMWNEASNDMQKAVQTAADTWASSGHVVIEIDWPDVFNEAYDAHQTIQDYECCRANAWEMDTHGDLISPLLMETLQAGLLISRTEYLKALNIAAEARSVFSQIQADVDIILTPSAPSAAPKTLQSTGTSIFNRFLTLMGVPCINLPAYQNSDNLPVGIQLVGRFGEDDELLSFSQRLWEHI